MHVVNKYKVESVDGFVFIGRGSPVGNPFVINRDGGGDGDRETVIAKYREWLRKKLISRDDNVCRFFMSLNHDSVLWCYCKPKACHGDVIIEFWNEIYNYGTFELGLHHFILRHSTSKIFDPINDGVDHINIYSKGETVLGRQLSHFTAIGFRHPEYGLFESVEGFWYWLSTGMKHDKLRSLSGFAAKTLGRTFIKVPIDNFEQEIEKANRLKIEQNTGLLQMFKTSKLPFAHYYYYGSPDNCKIIPLENFKWLVDSFERIRASLNESQ